ncbi:MAG: phage holin family protein [Solirubrobacterales bacterium]|nr:phage holin family protein [Solirubrobacterales bacterium]
MSAEPGSTALGATPAGQAAERAQADAKATSNLGEAVQEITQRAQVLVRDEIELARVELTEKIGRLVRGAVVGAVAGVFALLGLIFLLHGLSWLAWDATGDNDNFWIGFGIIALLLFILGAIAGALAFRFVKAGTPPTPEMAIDEAQRIKQTVDEARSR